MPRATPMDPDARREQLLAAGRRVFAERGYHNAGVSHIIAEAGVARGTFYNYFESKRALFQEVLVRLTVDVVRAVEPIDVTRDIPSQVRGIIRAIVVAALDSDTARLLLSEAVGVDDEGDDAIRAFYQGALLRLETALTVGQQLGIVREGNLHLAARGVLGMVKEQVFFAALFGENADVDDVVDELYASLTSGLLRVAVSES
jgi:AcrR family transcriptional regulator